MDESVVEALQSLKADGNSVGRIGAAQSDMERRLIRVVASACAFGQADATGYAAA